MQMNWQDAIALGVVLAAVVVVFRRLRRAFSPNRSCGGGCCKPAARSNAQELISIDPPRKP